MNLAQLLQALQLFLIDPHAIGAHRYSWARQVCLDELEFVILLVEIFFTLNVILPALTWLHDLPAAELQMLERLARVFLGRGSAALRWPGIEPTQRERMSPSSLIMDHL
jgi:hypothetical protein